jgi:ribosome biogenesis GTPase A
MVDEPMKKKSPKKPLEIEGIELTPDAPIRDGFNWFPGHMVKAIREIKEKLKTVDIVFEIRDARAPLASGNKTLDETLRQKSRLIILNKVNLADPKMIAQWDVWFKKEGVPFIFIDCFDRAQMKKVLAMAKTIVMEKRKKNNPEIENPKQKMRLMVIGLPNTGKSTIINQLAGRAAVKVADKPGQTQVQQLIVIDKDLDLLDTPGVMPPSFAKEEHGLWLCALNAIPEDVVGDLLPARFIIEYYKNLSPENAKTFIERYKLENLDLKTLSADEIMEKIAVLRGCLKQKGALDLERVYKLVLHDFRKGELGKCCFGVPPAN